MVPGTITTSPCTYTVKSKEMMEFARKWDPLDMHTDEALAAASPMKCLTASSRYTMAVSSWLLNRMDPMLRVTAMFGMEAVRLPRPVLPDDVLSICSTVLEQGRESSKRRDQGVLKLHVEVLKQGGKVVLEWEERVLVQRKQPQPKL